MFLSQQPKSVFLHALACDFMTTAIKIQDVTIKKEFAVSTLWRFLNRSQNRMGNRLQCNSLEPQVHWSLDVNSIMVSRKQKWRITYLLKIKFLLKNYP